jgi:formylglycine-generating enzyme required for sulfatase activity
MPLLSKSLSHVCLAVVCIYAMAAFAAEFAQGQEALSEPSLPTLTNSIGMKLVQIPAGRFSMGSPTSEVGSEEDETLHKVELTRAYYLATTEVTEHQWALVMEPAFTTEEVDERDPNSGRFIRKVEKQIPNPRLGSQLPITNISWDQAVEFCQRLGQLPEEKKEGRNYRLPTEAEWEHACRAGTASAYSFGDDANKLLNHAWFLKNSKYHKHPVSEKKPNAWGFYDMHGNVWEWCSDRYGKYPDELVTDPQGPAAGSNRVFRGGSWNLEARYCRSGVRGWNDSSFSNDNVGFRVALSPTEISK